MNLVGPSALSVKEVMSKKRRIFKQFFFLGLEIIYFVPVYSTIHRTLNVQIFLFIYCLKYIAKIAISHSIVSKVKPELKYKITECVNSK